MDIGGVKVLSREMVKPSTHIVNHHPNEMKLSYLDHIVPNVYIPIIFFYQANDSNQLQLSHNLKHSLSQTLTSFYPLAGRLNNGLVVDCNDEGVEYVEARAHARLADACKHADVKEHKLKQYLPLDPIVGGICSIGAPLLRVQITYFDCGGIALGICCSHQISDCTSLTMFIKSWASTCASNVPRPVVSFDLANYFPPRDIPTIDWGSFILSDEKFAAKRLVFDKEKIKVLKQNATTVKNPTRVEVITAFIWKQFIEHQKRNSNNPKSVRASIVVNLRGRKTHPPHLPKSVFGNCVMGRMALSRDGVHKFDDLVVRVRNTIREIDDDYIEASRDGDKYLLDMLKLFDVFPNGEENETLNFSSWSRMSLYEMDFGFGAPNRICALLDMMNTVILIGDRSEENMEIWVNLEPHYFEMLRHQIDRISVSQDYNI